MKLIFSVILLFQLQLVFSVYADETNKESESACLIATQECKAQQELERAKQESRLESLSNTYENQVYKANERANLEAKFMSAAKQSAQDLESAETELSNAKGTSGEDEARKIVELRKIDSAKAGSYGKSSRQIELEMETSKITLDSTLEKAKLKELGDKAAFEERQRKLGYEKKLLEKRLDDAEKLMKIAYPH